MKKVETINDAFNILMLPYSPCYTLQEIKKQYHYMCLQYHPDKNPTIGTETFVNIQMAFEYINENYMFSKGKGEEKENGKKDNGKEKGEKKKETYQEMLLSFINSFADIGSTSACRVILQMMSRKMTSNILENVGKHTCIFIYRFLSQYKTVLWISDDVLSEMKKIIQDKMWGDGIVLLNPTIDDMLDHNIYRLEYQEVEYFVPLWYETHVFDIVGQNKGNELVVKCIPNLPENVKIDMYQNILVDLEYNMTDIMGLSEITFTLGPHVYSMPVEVLKIQRCQTFTIRGKGIIREECWLENEDPRKSDIIVKLKLILV